MSTHGNHWSCECATCGASLAITIDWLGYLIGRCADHPQDRVAQVQYRDGMRESVRTYTGESIRRT